MRSLTTKTFNAVAQFLDWIARKTGMTYNEVNILVYYLLIPLSWTILFDLWIKTPYTTIFLLSAWIGVFMATYKNFRCWCDKAFRQSVNILNYFNRWGGNYELNSVVICVILPICIYAFLIAMLL